ncbi:MAG: YeeE/YedE family protein [Pseudomonas sp.]
MKRGLAALLSGLLFGLGLALAGMTDPRKVLAFLDLAGAWDPSLLWVLGAAVAVALTGFQLARRRPAPLLEGSFQPPPPGRIDRALLLGALLFGIGWGIAGYCPGPALASLANGNRELLAFLPALLLGQWLQRRSRTPSR